MLLKKIILENYGLYSGRVVFDLTPRVKYRKVRPIILIGGKNGSGKTTFLEALCLVLYGKNSLGNRISNTEYETYLRTQIHQGKNDLLRNDHARIAVVFDHVEQGEKKQYQVERSWICNEKRKVTEFLKISVDDQTMHDVSPDFWQGFVEGLIPERLSQLFFFDGEKIQNLAEDAKDSRILAESTKILLGLDLVERLKADLSIYASREAKKCSNKDNQKKLKILEEEIFNTANSLHNLMEKQAEIQTTIDGIHSDLRKRERHLQQQGHVFAGKRQDFQEKKATLIALISSLEDQIRQECETTYPFALCPTIAQKLRNQLHKEKEVQRISLVKDELQELREELSRAFVNAKAVALDIKQDFQKIIRQTINSKIALTEHLEDLLLIQSVSDIEMQQFFSWLTDAQTRSLPTAQKIGNRLNQGHNELRDIVKELHRGPEEAQVELIFQELSVLNQRLGKYGQKEKQIQEEIRKQENSLRALQRDHKRLVEQQLAHDNTSGRIARIQTIQIVLDAYLQRLTEKKIEQLCVAVTQGFNLLSRKGDLIQKITIDPATFISILYDHSGRPIPQEKLSSGEKQLYAIAMLWGLAKTSGRPLPVIIDTPLSRLDSEHRRNLIHNYFPFASHQVILLSTDTEVDQQLYKELSPYLSHCYHLVYDKKTQATKPREEYFWKESKQCPN